MDDDMLDASDIEVKCQKGEVTLTGTVDSKEAKRRAEDCAESVLGVSHVQNNLRVQSGSHSGSQSGSHTGSQSGSQQGTRSEGSGSSASSASGRSEGSSSQKSAGSGS
jgi:hypothetical protein